jgi:hypothetical protein
LSDEGFANFFDCGVCGIDRGVAQLFEGNAEADGRVFQMEVMHVEIVFEALGEGFFDAADKEFVFAEAHGGDVRELVVFVDEGGVRVRGVAAAGEDVEEDDGVARFEPVGDGDRKGKRCIVAVRGEDEDLQDMGSYRMILYTSVLPDGPPTRRAVTS